MAGSEDGELTLRNLASTGISRLNPSLSLSGYHLQPGDCRRSDPPEWTQQHTVSGYTYLPKNSAVTLTPPHRTGSANRRDITGACPSKLVLSVEFPCHPYMNTQGSSNLELKSINSVHSAKSARLKGSLVASFWLDFISLRGF